MVKNEHANTGDIKRCGLIPGLGRLLEEGMELLGESPGQRSLADFSP